MLSIPSTIEHAEALAPIMNEDDKAEIWASAHSTPIESLTMGLEYSNENVTMVGDEGEIIAMLGVVPMTIVEPYFGIPWALGSYHQKKYSKAFLRASKDLTASWLETYEKLENFVDVRHRRSLRWLRWLGFTIPGDIILHGPDNHPFYRFYKEREA